MFKKDIKITVIGTDGATDEVELGELARKYAESLRAGTDEFLVDIAVWDPVADRLYPTKARIRAEEHRAPIMGIKSTRSGAVVLYCSRDTRLYTTGGPTNPEYPGFGPIPVEKLGIGYIGREVIKGTSHYVTAGAKITEMQINSADYDLVSVKITDPEASKIFFASRLAVMEPDTV